MLGVGGRAEGGGGGRGGEEGEDGDSGIRETAVCAVIQHP
jgi:hypothetical protein